MRRIAPAVAVVALCAAALAGLVACGGGGDAGAGTTVARSGATAAPELAPPVASGLTVPEPRALTEGAATAWASVRVATVARRAPSRTAPAVAGLDLLTPEGTTNLVVLAGGSRRVAGRLWVRARVPGGTARNLAWVPRDALGAGGVSRARVVIDTGSRELRVLRDGRRVMRARVGVGTPANPTPAGEFYIRNRLTRYSSPAYGPLAFGTSARSPTVTDWPGGGWVGIHGTDRPELIPGDVSHGCVRLRNDDLRRLARLVGVGTPVSIV